MVLVAEPEIQYSLSWLLVGPKFHSSRRQEGVHRNGLGLEASTFLEVARRLDFKVVYV